MSRNPQPGRQVPLPPDDGRPITLDPNLEDLATVAAEIQLAERLGPKWKSTFHKLPTAAYGVEWAATETASGKLRAFVHFVHGEPEVRLSRVFRGQAAASAANSKFTVVIIRGAKSGFIDGHKIKTGEAYAGVHGEQPELFVRIPESDITPFKKD